MGGFLPIEFGPQINIFKAPQYSYPPPAPPIQKKSIIQKKVCESFLGRVKHVIQVCFFLFKINYYNTVALAQLVICQLAVGWFQSYQNSRNAKIVPTVVVSGEQKFKHSKDKFDLCLLSNKLSKKRSLTGIGHLNVFCVYMYIYLYFSFIRFFSYFSFFTYYIFSFQGGENL